MKRCFPAGQPAIKGDPMTMVNSIGYVSFGRLQDILQYGICPGGMSGQPDMIPVDRVIIRQVIEDCPQAEIISTFPDCQEKFPARCSDHIIKRKFQVRSVDIPPCPMEMKVERILPPGFIIIRRNRETNS